MLTAAQRHIMRAMKGGGGKLGFDIPTQSYFLESALDNRSEEPVRMDDIEALAALGYVDLTHYFFDAISGTTYHDLTAKGLAALGLQASEEEQRAEDRN